ncbi:hypothetical protein M9H77_20680 [Catharanthus roseus]|uniref:Uncharacterized protein n=1 Tax=Catharanthus roseus TaxID=4058 RepID=A0ACC0ALN5_CATRO|nr:hypothetical protein M9H77_20680 [Catharanthus roseus]
MSAARNSSYYKLKGAITLLQYRYRISSSSPTAQLQSYHWNLGYGGNYMNQGLGLIISAGNREAGTIKSDFARAKDFQSPVPPPPPSPSPPSQKPFISTWVKWLLGTVLSTLLPFWKQKWEGLLQLEGKVEKVVEEVEEVAEVVEKVATVAEKISAEAAEQLPDNSIIKKAALAVEHASNATAADAQLTQNFIHKVEDVKQDLKDLEGMVEPVIDNIIKVDMEPHQNK